MISNVQKPKYQAYVSATQTVAKTKQIIMLYDGVIRLMQQAKEAIREKRIEDRFNLLMKASNIIHGLQGCLDFDNGKDVANVLYGFYSSVDNRIFSVHRTNSVETCDQVIDDFRQMRDAWQLVDATLCAEDASSLVPAASQSPVDDATATPAAPLNITISA